MLLALAREEKQGVEEFFGIQKAGEACLIQRHPQKRDVGK